MASGLRASAPAAAEERLGLPGDTACSCCWAIWRLITAYAWRAASAEASISSTVAPRTISVQSAGITYHSSNGLHRNDPLSNDKRNFTSRGRISEAMVIRRDLVDHGIAYNTDLGHVLHMFLVETRSSDGFRHPMVACEGGKNGFGAEG